MFYENFSQNLIIINLLLIIIIIINVHCKFAW